MNEGYYPDARAAAGERTLLVRVYGWMTLALVLTGLAAMYAANSEAFVRLLLSDRFFLIGLLIAEIVVVLVLTAMINKLSATAATVGFIAYALLNGLTFSIYFLIFTASSIAAAFFVTAGMFGAMSAYGYMTKRDLTGIGHFCLMGLVGLVIASVVNLFLRNTAVYWVTTYIGVLVFVGLTAYDTQKIKRLAADRTLEGETLRKASILGALRLYLDFINLFLMLLRIMGRRR